MTTTEVAPDDTAEPDDPGTRVAGAFTFAVVKPLVGLVVPVTAVVAALAVGAVMLLALGANPLKGYAALFDGAFGSWDALADTAIKSMPLLLVGVGICIAFRAGVINIGGEGQIILGAIFSTTVALLIPDTPRILLVPLVLMAGAVGGGLWGAIPGALKAYAGVSEILATIMMNIIAAQFLSFLLQDLLIEEGAIKIQQTERLDENSHLPLLPGGTRLHLGVIIAISVAILGYILLFRSALGMRLRSVGHNPNASKYAGMAVKRSIVQAMAFSGACAGVAGAILVFGSESHRLIGEGGASAFTQSAGFNGIVAALFGALHPLWTIPASFFFGGMLTGGIQLQQELQVPAALIVALNGVVVIFVVGSLKLRTRVNRWVERNEDARARAAARPSTQEVAADVE
ncbi:MAG: ABC transporter permease [Ilumatobacter sp.]|nr:ABC transporter permease [Ilumatobacter sp.]